MKKFLGSLLLIAPFFAEAIGHIDLTASEARNLSVSLGEEFMVTAIHNSRASSIPWILRTDAPFELLYKGWNEGCIRSVMAANTQIWTFKATQLGSYEIEFYKHGPSPLAVIYTEKISVEVY